MALENLGTIVTIVIEQMFCKEGFVGAQRDGTYFGIGHFVDLLFYQLLIFIHNLSTPPICNKVKMHIKVDCNSRNIVQFMDNIINSTFTWVNTGRREIAKFASKR
jgi:hypothetical protein